MALEALDRSLFTDINTKLLDYNSLNTNEDCEEAGAPPAQNNAAIEMTMFNTGQEDNALVVQEDMPRGNQQSDKSSLVKKLVNAAVIPTT